MKESFYLEALVSQPLGADNNWRSVVDVFLDAPNSASTLEAYPLEREVVYRTQWQAQIN